MRWGWASIGVLATLGLTTACGFSGQGLGGTSGDDGGLLDGTAMVQHGHPDGSAGYDANNPLDGGLLEPDCGADKILDANTCVSCPAGDVVRDGGCVSCGAAGEPCCANSVCNAPNSCGAGGMPPGVCGCTQSDCCTGKACGTCTNNCNVTQACAPGCSPPDVCQNYQCVCIPKVCGANMCGVMSDGCGHNIDCGGCSSGCCGGNTCHAVCDCSGGTYCGIQCTDSCGNSNCFGDRCLLPWNHCNQGTCL
jgi:hypothetical protein